MTRLTRLSHRSFLNPFLIQFALEDALHVNAGRMDHVRLQLPDLDQVLDFRDRHFGSGRHHGIEVARRLPINQIAPGVALPGFHQGEIGFQSSRVCLFSPTIVPNPVGVKNAGMPAPPARIRSEKVP